MKAKIKDLGIPCPSVVLKLDDSRTLGEYGLQQGSVVHTGSWEKEEGGAKEEEKEEDDSRGLKRRRGRLMGEGRRRKPEDYRPKDV
jgi:hypothetical protein